MNNLNNLNSDSPEPIKRFEGGVFETKQCDHKSDMPAGDIAAVIVAAFGGLALLFALDHVLRHNGLNNDEELVVGVALAVAAAVSYLYRKPILTKLKPVFAFITSRAVLVRIGWVITIAAGVWLGLALS